MQLPHTASRACVGARCYPNRLPIDGDMQRNRAMPSRRYPVPLAAKWKTNVWLVAAGVGLLAFGLLAAFGLRRLPPQDARTYESALAPDDRAWLDRQLAPQLEAHPEQSGFRLVADGVEAFALRALTAQRAERSLDVQTYIWHADTTGVLLIRELLNAADRGVRVRVLLDDLDARSKNFELVAIDAHPNIEVRIFNPFVTREGVAGKIIEGLTSFSRINRRMHNKAWIADNRLAIVGGRNLGDEYFTASDRVNFVDLDFAMIGPVVGETSEAFDRYWNSAAVWPMAALNPTKVAPARAAELRAAAEQRFLRASQSSYVAALASSRPLQVIAMHPDGVRWSSRWQVLADDPMKARLDNHPLASSAVLRGLTAWLRRAQREITLVSAYFVPGELGTELLTRRSRAGNQLSILTNSLAATDVVAVHGGYAKYRRRLIANGAALWELKPDPMQTAAGWQVLGSSEASLHTKAVVIDREHLFVGSFNLDPRSVSLNCEHGVMVGDSALAEQAGVLFERLRAGEHAWRVGLDAEGQLRWSDGHRTESREPGASLSRRVFSHVFGLLPIESQL
jgi:putative cardiolipin synthase